MDTVKPKLLMADDSLPMRTVVEMAFTDEGFDVWTANDGESAMLKFIEIQPDILMVDVGLPDMSGYQICEMIKQDETTRHIPVLLLVGSYEPYDADEARRAGADGHLTKPFRSKKELVECVKELIQTDEPQATVAPETDDIEDLYKSSFSDTAKIEDFETVEDNFGAEDFDDEMIEAISPHTPVEDHVEENSTDETASVNEFDWSPEAVVTPNGEPTEIEVEHSRSFEGPAAAATMVEDDEVLVFSPAVTETPAIDESVVETTESLAPEAQESETIEPSPELIALVADRVIERLSDQVIREIAEQTVPRIAEKLMREALSGTKRED